MDNARQYLSCVLFAALLAVGCGSDGEAAGELGSPGTSGGGESASTTDGPASSEPQEIAVATAETDPAAYFGRCYEVLDEGIPGDYIEWAESWVTLAGSEANRSQLETDAVHSGLEFEGDGNLEMRGNGRIELELSNYDLVGESDLPSVGLFYEYVPGSLWALSNGQEVHIAVLRSGTGADLALYVITSTADGEYFFPGGCYYEGVTEPLRRRLGSDFDRVVSSLVGQSGDVVAELLRGGGDLDDIGPSIPLLEPELDGGDLDPELLSLTFAVHVPGAWVGKANTLCTRIVDGWNGCLNFTRIPESGVVLLPALYKENDGQIEFWLADNNANLAPPLQLLGTVDVSSMPSVERLDNAGFVVRIDLGGSFGEDAIEDATVAATRWSAVSDAIANPDLARQIVGDEVVDELLRQVPELEAAVED